VDLPGDDDVQPAQQGGGAGGAGLLAGEPVVVAGGQVGELGRHDRVVRQCRPHCPPRGYSQAGPAAAGDRGFALVAAGGVVARAQPGVLDSDRGVANRFGSPVSARIAAAPMLTGVQPISAQVNRLVSDS